MSFVVSSVSRIPATEAGVRTVEPVLAGCAALALFGATCARDVEWGDSAKLALYVWRLNPSFDLEVHLGALVWAWPFSRVPIGPFAFRVTVASVVAGALTVALLHSMLLKRCRNRWAARTGTAAFAVSHTFWFVTTIPESYPVSILATTVAAWLILDVHAPLSAGLVIGLGATANVLTLFTVPAAVWWLRRRAPRIDALRLLGGLALGIGLVVTLALPFQPAPFRSSAGEWLRAFQSYIDWRAATINAPLLAAYFVFNFAGPALLLVAAGWKTAARDQRITILLIAAAHYGFALLYLPQRAYLIPIPVYLAAAWLVAAGADDFLMRHRRSAGWMFTTVAVVPPMVYAAAAIALAGRPPAVVRDAPFRDEVKFYLQPWKSGDDSVRRYLRAVAAAVPDGSTMFGDFTIAMPMLYASRVEGWMPRSQWELVDGQTPGSLEASIDLQLAAGRRVFLLDRQPYYFADHLGRRWALVDAGVPPMLEVIVSGAPRARLP